MVEQHSTPISLKEVSLYLKEPGTLTRRGFLKGMAKDPLIFPNAIIAPIGVVSLTSDNIKTKTAGLVETVVGGGVLLQRGVVWWRSRGGRLDSQLQQFKPERKQYPPSMLPPAGS